MKTSLPLVSVLINNYNYGRFLRNAIDSVLNQTYPNIEVIVVDDGSTDNSQEIIATYGTRIIPVLKPNGGQASAFNSGFATSKGEWIHFLDSDDIFLPNKLARIQELRASYAVVGMIAHNLEYCDANGAVLDFACPDFREMNLVDDRQKARRGKLSAVAPATSGLCFRRDILAKILPMPEEIRITADNYLKLVVPSLTQTLVVPEALARQRIHDHNLYTRDTKDSNDAAKLRCAKINALIAFHLRKEYPNLAPLAWRQYGRILYQLKTLQSPESRAVAKSIRTQYGIFDYSLKCMFNVAGAFTGALRRDLMHTSLNG